MAEIVNLRQARKRKARGEARREGDANALKHGRRKADRTLDAAVSALETRRLDGHRLGGEATGPDAPPDQPSDPDARD